MKKKYTFIHPTKSGGTSLGKYFKKNYSIYIQPSHAHKEVCTNKNKPIIVIRDVKTRFFSMYKYWKNGSEKRIRTEYLQDRNKNKTIFDFIDFIKTKNRTELYLANLWDVHFKPTTFWINNTDYKNIIIIRYQNNLDTKVQKLIDLLGIPNKNIPVPMTNVSYNKNCEYDLNDIVVNKFIDEYFRDDIELINKINSHPELFKLVI